MRRERPGDIVRAIRGKKGVTREIFSRLLGWQSAEVVRNIENHRTVFARTHLEDLIRARYVDRGSDVERQFEKAMEYDWEVRQKQRQKQDDDDQKEEAGVQPDQEEPASQPQLLRKINVRWLIASLLLALIAGCIVGFFIGQRLPNVVGKGKPTEAPLAAEILSKTPMPRPTHTSVPSSTPTTRRPTSTPTATPTIATPTATPKVVLPFEDNFDVGKRKPEWEILEGDWRIVDDRLSTISRKGEWSHMLVGDPSWRNYVVKVDAGLWRPSDPVRIIVRAQDANNMMVFYAISSYFGESAWGLMRDGKWYLLAKGSRVDRDVTIRVDVSEDQYVAYVDGKRWLSVNDPTFTTGRAGLSLYCDSDSNCNWLDNFRVEPLSG